MGIDGKDSKTDYCLRKPGNQYTIKDKVHALTKPPSSIAIKPNDKMHKPRLNKKEKELINELKELASLRILQLKPPETISEKCVKEERSTFCHAETKKYY